MSRPGSIARDPPPGVARMRCYVDYDSTPMSLLTYLLWPGVGGMRGFTQVRCLHVHTAHALVAGGEANIVGRWVLEALRNGEDAEANDYQKAHEPPTSARARAAVTAAPATLATHTTGTVTGTPAGTGTTSAVQAETGTWTCRRAGSTRPACVRAPPTGWWHPVLRLLTAASAHSVLGVL